MAITHLPIFKNFPTWQKLINANLTYIDSALGGSGAPATADYLVKTANAGLSAELVVTDTATVTWDWSTPGQAKANSSGSGAPTTADYLVKTADAGLSAERVVTDTATVTWDWATPGQVKANASATVADGDKGDVVVSSTGTVWTLDSAVTPRKAQASVDFGAATQETETATVSVAATWVTANSYIVCAPAAVATAEHDVDDYSVEGITASVTNISAGVGFDIVARAAERTFGTYLINAIGLA